MGRYRTGDRVVVVGAGFGGLAAAALLAARGFCVTVVEGAAAVGGKARTLPVDAVEVAAGPTVLTLKPVFDRLFADCGAVLDDRVALAPLPLLARHAWPDGGRLDLWADRAASRDAIGCFAGAAAARGFDCFSAAAAHVWQTLAADFVMRQRPRGGPVGLSWRLGLHRLAALQACRPYESLWSVLQQWFADPRLVQLFGRYATYCGSSPLRAPATLMLIAHVEQLGVWRVGGGIARLAAAIAELAEGAGASIRLGTPVAAILVDGGRACGVELAGGERLEADAVIANCDPAALADGRFGAAVQRAVRPLARAQRSFSALTWMLHARAEGFALAHHNIFFAPDSRAEFKRLGEGRLPDRPTAYVCAQDRHMDEPPGGPERLQIIVNAPALGDRGQPTQEEIRACEKSMWTCLQRSGLWLRSNGAPPVRVGPAEYESRFPSTGGALYGRASHGWAASFLRPGTRTAIPGLLLAGGATHPGAGVPMATISGRLAAETLIADRVSMRRFHPAATPGGMSMPSATTAATG